jgi:hypothetical protein
MQSNGQDAWQELDPSSQRSNEMARSWRGLCPAVDCSGLMMMMNMIGTAPFLVEDY